MADEDAAAPPLRLVNFVSEDQLDRAKKSRGERVEDGTAQRDRPLYEILKENKDRKDAEFNERFKHRPPKALDEDETEFLDNLAESRREYERQLANEEADQLRIFQEALAAQSSVVHEWKEPTAVSKVEEHKPATKRSQPLHPRNIIISVKPQAKKAKKDAAANGIAIFPQPSDGSADSKTTNETKLGALVTYSDESEDDG